MRYDKEIYAAEESFVYERVDLSRLRAGQDAILYHMRPTRSGIICAEQSKVFATLPYAASRIYMTDDEVYVYESAQKSLYNVGTKSRITGINTEPVALLTNMTETGAKGLYCVEKATVRYISAGAVVQSGISGGTCAVMHHGRLFVADGLRLRFSAPYSTEGITQTERDPNKAGYIDFDDGKGRIIALASYRDRLYLFFERGIMKMSAEGAAVEFKAEEFPFRGGQILPDSVAVCGDRVCYMTTDGLFSVNGGTTERLEAKRLEINFNSAVRATCLNGNYALKVKLTNLRTALYVYDFTERASRFILEKGMTFAERDKFLVGTTLYTLSEISGVPLGYDALVLVTVATPPRAIAWVRVDGLGDFEVRTNAGSGAYSVKGGDKVRIGGKEKSCETQVSVTVKSETFRIFGIEIAWRKEDGN